VRAEVIEGLEMFRLAGDHIEQRASRMPGSWRGEEVRLKPDTTYASPDRSG
jgi:hypothetical protein